MFVLVGFAALFFLLDQSSKRTAPSKTVRLGACCTRFIKFRCVKNQNHLYRKVSVQVALAALWFLALTSAMLLRRHGVFFQSPVAMAGLGCALGGAAGNLLDILRRKCVVDFIDLGWWPVFNMADLSIVVGLALAFWS